MNIRTRFLGAWLAVGLALLSQAYSQTLLTLEDDTRNIFSLQPSTAYPPPPPSLDQDPRTPTANQWKSATTVGGWLTTRIKDGTGTVLAGSPDTVAGPTTVKLPSFIPTDGSGVQLQSVQMSRPLAGRVPTVLFGDVIARPTVDQAGAPINQSDYLPEPDNTSGGKFYYSPHARSVFATQSGVIDIVWRFRDPARVPATLTLTYVVSASPARPAKRMYWTEKGFNGPIVQVPQGPISTLNVIYSPQFPSQIGAEYDSPYDVPADPNLQLPPEKRTLWFSSTDRALHCYNIEGRVFIEILGALKADNVTRQHLGTEIVEAIREVAPLAVTTFVGDQILPHNGDTSLQARIINGLGGSPAFLYSHGVASRNRVDYYAVHTTNQSTDAPDLPTGEVLIHWTEQGNYGLVWPKYYQTYLIKWPAAGDAYSTFVRQDAGEGDADATGVLLNGENNPFLIFQDDPSGQQAVMKDAVRFYTNLDADDPGSRSLIRYTKGEAVWFERVESRLNSTFTGFTGTPIPTDVGSRIEPPTGFEATVGYIRETTGTAFDPTAYKNPFTEGLAASATGAIIGVNARPGHNILEVWWYKANTPPAGSGLAPTYWPAAVQKYALRWPAAPPEIILAANKGSDDLPSRQATGSIYYQNDPVQPGFNPNDEHALMIAGRAWALRDDLGTPQTSQPHVLLRYAAADNRPAITVFKVLREKPEAGIEFKYNAVAGTILQAPMPLPVLPLPLLSDKSSANRQSYAEKGTPPNIASPLTYRSFTFKDRKQTTWVYRGPHDDTEAATFKMQFYYLMQEGFFLPGLAQQPAAGTVMPYLRPANANGGFTGSAVYFENQSADITFTAVWPSSVPQLRVGETLTLPRNGLPAVRGQTSAVILYDQALAVAENDAEARSAVLFDPTRAKSVALGDGLAEIPGGVATSNYQGKTYFPNLPPHLSQRFFLDPNKGAQGSLVLEGEFKDEVLGDDYLLLNTLGEKDVAILKALCPAGLDKADWDDAVDGLETVVQTFEEDPTKLGTYRAHKIGTTTEVDTALVDAVWNWVKSRNWKAFPSNADSKDLPNNITFADFTTALAGTGKSMADLVPSWEWFIEQRSDLRLLMLKETKDIIAAFPFAASNSYYYALGIGNFSARHAWAIKFQSDLKASLTKKLTETVEKLVTAGVDELPEIQSSDTAVDSYALTADGSGEGYVVMVAGNGRAFTPADEPVSIHVIKVSPPLGRGELKVIAPSNPLDEKLTLQQSLDFAAVTESYDFEWRYAPPVDGSAPPIYTFDRQLLFGDGAWNFTSGSGVAASVSLPGALDAHEGTQKAVLSRTFQISQVPLRLFLSLNAGRFDGITATLNGIEVASSNVPGTADTPVASKPSPAFTPLGRLMEISPNSLQEGVNVLELTIQTTSDAGALTDLNVRLEAMVETERLEAWLPVGTAPGETNGALSGSVQGKSRHIIQGPGIFSLTDNYFVCRHRANDDENVVYDEAGGWSKWTEPQLAEGWIKRALAGINPFQQRVKDLYNNDVNTDVSLLTQAGRRWEGDIALNLENIDSFGLIEIYETILRRGKMLSIEGTPPLSYGPANDALLLAAGYLNDLYMLVGNEAFADAANPSIAFSTDGGQFGDIATSLFAFKGQQASVLDEELSLLRGRDDFLAPGVRTAPVYNRLIWNYTRGIDSGEAVYALNYNIKDLNSDGIVDARDAAQAYPQGHGDAYGHYLTAVTNYYGLLRNPLFGWIPRSEAVTVLGKPVAVDYFDERKFAAAAAALARTTALTVDLTYRKAYVPAAATNATWTHLQDGRVNNQTGVTRRWGVDDWATRGGQGSFLHWVSANSMLPDVDPDPNHEGIQKIDRHTVTELAEMVLQGKAIQQSLDTADARLNPLGISGGALPFDISPAQVDGGKTHFEQIYDRAVGSLQNAVAAFNNAKGSTQLLRSQDDSLSKQREVIQNQERAFIAQLTDIYGSPYAEDIGPGKTYKQGYKGPDLAHFLYIDMPELFKNQPKEAGAKEDEDGDEQEIVLRSGTDFSNINVHDTRWGLDDNADRIPENGLGDVIVYKLDGTGKFIKPDDFSVRSHPGRIQEALSGKMLARLHLSNALEDYSMLGLETRRLIRSFQSAFKAHGDERSLLVRNAAIFGSFELATAVLEKIDGGLELKEEIGDDAIDTASEALPKILGLANDPTFAARAALKAARASKNAIIGGFKIAISYVTKAIELSTSNMERIQEIESMDIAWTAEHKQLLADLKAGFEELEDGTRSIDQALRALDGADRKYRALLAEGIRIQSEREVFRQKAAALVQGYRTKDFGFRAFRNEALESYKSLFDLAARYTFLAARAYDYETGLANAAGSPIANDFFQKIVQARALGVFSNGAPQNAGSQGGDPGLSGALARMNSDWSVVKSRLGFNNPDKYRTTFSLRMELQRILPGVAGDAAWSDVLAASKMNNILDDPDVTRYCMQVNSSGALTVPGYVIPFQTTISEGYNFFGNPLAAGDSTYTSTSFATKVRSVGVAFRGYAGMASPSSIGGSISNTGAVSPLDPNLGFTDPNALSGTPFVYLVAAGSDSMRSPAIGDSSVVRSWQVEDQAIPMPFDIGGADLNTGIFTTGRSLSENFTLRKHQAFRAVPDGTVFSSGAGFTNSRLIGRSVWNSRWKLIIPARTLLADPVKGMQIFQQTVKDIKVHFETYSYSGN